MLSSRPRTAASMQMVGSIDVEHVFTNEDITNAGIIVGEIAKAINSGLLESKEAMKSLHVRFSDASAFVTRCLAMFDNLLQKTSPKWQMAKMTEDTIAFMILDPIMNAFLDNTIDVEYHGADYELPESRGRKLMQADHTSQPTKNVRGRKPDRSASINGRHVFLAELKTAKNSHDRSDVVKIGTMMKDVVDMALQKGHQREEISVVGLLVEGENCSIHLMQSPSQAFYNMHQVRKFELPKNQSNVKVLLNTAISFELCRALVVKAVYQSSVAPEEGAQNVRWSSFSPPHHAEYYA